MEEKKVKKKGKAKPKKTSKKVPKVKALKKTAKKEKKLSKEKYVKPKKEKLEKILETPKEELKEEFEEKPEEKSEEKKQGFFSRLVSRISQSPLKKEEFEEIFSELEITLLENNTSLEVVDKIKESLSSSLVGKSIPKKEIEKTILNSLKEAITSVLIEPPDLIKQIKDKQGIFTIIFVGINGSGKTTSIAKLAYKLKKAGISCVLAAGDTFRAASIEQLQIHGDALKIHVVKNSYGSDPASVAYDAKKYAEAHNIKAVLIDTAGRMYTKQNLIKEMEKIVRVSQPDLKMFIGESITGNDATEQAKIFNESINIDGIILSKADVDEKAGAILSVSFVTKKPIYFLGTGQSCENLELFTKEKVLKNLGLS